MDFPLHTLPRGQHHRADSSLDVAFQATEGCSLATLQAISGRYPHILGRFLHDPDLDGGSLSYLPFGPGTGARGMCGGGIMRRMGT